MSDNVHGYLTETEWKVSGNGKFTFGIKHGKPYFIKELNSPVYPYNKENYTQKMYKRSIDECKEFEKSTGKLIKDLEKASGKCKSIVCPKFFREGPRYYFVSEKITDRTLSVDEVSKLDINVKLDLALQFANALEALQSVNIVHGDLKPSNLFVCETKSGLKLKIIDFDGCYYSGSPPNPELTTGTEKYYSPELGTYICSEDSDLKHIVTCKSDIFAAGLIIHEYFFGIKIRERRNRHAFQADLDSDLIIHRTSSKYSAYIKNLIKIKSNERFDAHQFKKYTEDLIKTHSIDDFTPGFESTRLRTTIIDKDLEPYILMVDDITYVYVDNLDNHIYITKEMAQNLSRNKRIPILNETSTEYPLIEPEIIRKDPSTVTVRMPDGSTISMPTIAYDIMKKKGKL